MVELGLASGLLSSLEAPIGTKRLGTKGLGYEVSGIRLKLGYTMDLRINTEVHGYTFQAQLARSIGLGYTLGFYETIPRAPWSTTKAFRVRKIEAIK